MEGVQIQDEYMAEHIASLAASNTAFHTAESTLERLAVEYQGSSASPGASVPRKSKVARSKVPLADVAAQPWWLDGIDLLMEHTSDRGAAAAQHIKAQLGDAESCAPSDSRMSSKSTCVYRGLID